MRAITTPDDNSASTPPLKRFYEAGVIDALELSAAECIQRLYEDDRPLLGLGVALSHAALRLGHLAVRVDHVAQDFAPEVIQAVYEHSAVAPPSLGEIKERDFPNPALWREILLSSEAVWSVETPFRKCPLVYDHGLLFTFKAWRGEAQVAHALIQLNQRSVGPIPNPRRLWGRLFEPIGTVDAPGEGWFEGGQRWDRARFALYTALRGVVSVIHGGPGTGKTTLTQRILAALLDQYDTAGEPLEIALAAPTGKAAQRLMESIRSQAPFFHLPTALQERLKGLQAQTLHSLLGVAPGRKTPEYHPGNPLPYDVIVVDEASMIDTWLMRALMDAIDLDEDGFQRRRLLLIGDPHQLPSVSAGAPFTELCSDRGSRIGQSILAELDSFLSDPLSSPDQDLASTLSTSLTELATSLRLSVEESALAHGTARFSDRVVALNQVQRVSDQSGIHRLATLIQNVETEGVSEVARCLSDGGFEDLHHESAPPLPRGLFQKIMRHYIEAVDLSKSDPLEALNHLKGLCLLSPHYGGLLGVNALNDLVETGLREARVGGWGHAYVGRPILITQNHPPTGLVNGDIGVIGTDQQVHFESIERTIPYDMLPPHRTVFAMSVHKSQGSEFQEVIFCLPPERSPILTRELIYTGLTRAKKSVVILGSLDVFKESIKAKVERGGSLGHRLSHPQPSFNLLKSL
jgi:exodeoxyribonuclease V alpha subunit